MEYISIIEKSLKEKGITAKKMLLDLGYSDNLISQWKKGSEPSAIKLNRIAQYLELSLDALFGNTVSRGLSEKEEKLVNSFEMLDETEQQIILGKIYEFLYNKKMEESSEKHSSEILWNLFTDPNRETLLKKKND